MRPRRPSSTLDPWRPEPGRLPSRGRAQRRLPSQAGLTLVELLVSMLIMGFVLTLVSQAVFQVSQVTRSAQSATAELTGRWASGWTVSPVLANLVVPPETPPGKAFEGTPSRLSAYTTLPLDGSSTGLRPFLLELEAAPPGGPEGTRLMASVPSSFTVERTDPAQVAYFPGRVEFAYVDDTGELHAQWPPLTVSARKEPQELPSAIAVRRPFAGDVLMWYPFQGDTRRPLPPSTPFGAGL